ncbi:hypothetical protein LA080_009153 [Diaporthe eres]|nr:hypothetical protein LA080_009153 [Diaporthe eres]
MPPWDSGASSFPQASDVGSTGCAPLANGSAPGAAGPSVSAIGSSPCRWLYDSWGGDRPAVVGGRVLSVCPGETCLLLNRAAVPRSLHLVNDLAGTMQPELPPIGRTPLGKSRGFIHDLNLSFQSVNFAPDGLNVSLDAHWASTMRQRMR